MYPVEYVDLNNSRTVAEVKSFLQQFDLTYQASDVEFTVILREQEHIIATGSFAGSVLRNFAVDPQHQGEGLAAQVISELIQELALRGRFHYFLYTKPDKSWMFSDLGLKEIVRGQYAALLEGGLTSIGHYLANINEKVKHLATPRAALVMNCNPFTLGHRYLIEKAAKENPGVIVFVVSEDCSTFPFADRLALVKAGVADLTNVVVVETGPYQVSKTTFPTYFTKGDQQQLAPTELDIRLFAQKIAPVLSIKRRYVGEEPYCLVTSAYNTSMQQLLPQLGIELVIVPRKTIGEEIISASQVRARLKEGDIQGVKMLVPPSTYAYLTDPEQNQLLKKIMNSDNKRH